MTAPLTNAMSHSAIRHEPVWFVVALLMLATGCPDTKTGNVSRTGNPAPTVASERARPEEAIDPAKIRAASRIRLATKTSQTSVSFSYGNDEDHSDFSIVESMGGGVAILDFDADGWQDIFCSGGGQFGNRNLFGNDSALYRNWGEWQFTEVTRSAGCGRSPHFSHGAAVTDTDEDGFDDLLVTGYGGLTLYRNQGDGTFLDTTALSGLTDSLWSTSAAWGDLNGDGVQDLYVTHYVDWSFDNHPRCEGQGGIRREVCPPRRFAPLPDTVYFGRGDGTFTDATATAGLRPGGKGIGVVLADVDLDSDLDIYVANDTDANFLYRNDGRGKFEDIALVSGTAVSDRGMLEGSMGTDVGDFNSDGLPDIWVTNYEHENFGLYRNLGQGQFLHVSQSLGVAAVGVAYVGWGTRFLDLDLDGDEDIFVSNGHVLRFGAVAPRRQRPLVFENVDGRRLVNVADTAGEYAATPHTGRGLAAGDLDQDGDEDLVLSNLNEPVELLSSESPDRGHSLTVRLIGRDSCRTPFGAVAIASVQTRKLMRQVRSGSSYASSSDTRLYFGCGTANVVDELLVTFPSRQTIRLTNLPCNQVVTVIEPNQSERPRNSNFVD